MLLTVNVGNTNTVVGVYDGRRLANSWRLKTDASRTHDELGILLHGLIGHAGLNADAIADVAISSVVPPLQFSLERMSERYFHAQPLFVGPGVKTGMPILYDNPREVGADRIVNAIAAYEKFKCGLIIVDFGTATTFDVVTPKGEYLGGAISTGVVISMEALFRNTSKLPRVEFARPPHVVGRNTVHSMQSGLVYGYVSLVDGMCERIQREVGYPTKVIATGGLSPLVASESRCITEVDEFLTLEGLRIVYERNHGP